MSVDTTVETSSVFGVHVPQPRQHGAAGGVMRRLNFGTGLIGGVALATIAGWGTAILTPSSASNATFAPMEPTYVYLAVLLGWVIGFMLGIHNRSQSCGNPVSDRHDAPSRLCWLARHVDSH